MLKALVMLIEKINKKIADVSAKCTGIYSNGEQFGAHAAGTVLMPVARHWGNGVSVTSV